MNEYCLHRYSKKQGVGISSIFKKLTDVLPFLIIYLYKRNDY